MEYQQVLRAQVIDPDEIQLSKSSADDLVNKQNQAAVALLQNSEVLLVEKLQSYRGHSQQALWLLSSLLLAVTFITSYFFIVNVYLPRTHSQSFKSKFYVFPFEFCGENLVINCYRSSLKNLNLSFGVIEYNVFVYG